MYDSDEVRDAVRRELLKLALLKSPPGDTTSIEYDAILDAQEAWIAERLAAWDKSWRAFAEALLETAEAIGRASSEAAAIQLTQAYITAIVAGSLHRQEES